MCRLNKVRGRMKSISGEGDMAGVEEQRLAVIVHMRIKIVYKIDDERAIVGRLEHGIDLVVARHCGFPLCSEEWKVHVAVMDDVIPVIRSARALVKKKGSNAPLCNVIFLMRERWIVRLCFCGGDVSDAAVGLRSRKRSPQLRNHRSWWQGKMILVQIDLILGCQAGNTAGVGPAAKEEMPLYHSLVAALYVSKTACVCGDGASLWDVPNAFTNCASASRNGVPRSRVMLYLANRLVRPRCHPHG
jgi:hypothetical protein